MIHQHVHHRGCCLTPLPGGLSEGGQSEGGLSEGGTLASCTNVTANPSDATAPISVLSKLHQGDGSLYSHCARGYGLNHSVGGDKAPESLQSRKSSDLLRRVLARWAKITADLSGISRRLACGPPSSSSRRKLQGDQPHHPKKVSFQELFFPAHLAFNSLWLGLTAPLT